MRRTALLPLLALLACGEPVVPGFEPEEVESIVLSAPHEEARTGREIPVLIRAMDIDGAPVAGAIVSMAIVEGSGELVSTSSRVHVYSHGRGARATMGSDGTVEVGLTPQGSGPLHLDAYVPAQARARARLEFHVILGIVLDYAITDAGLLWGLEPGFHGGRRVATGTPVEWVCACESDWGVVGTLESTGETMFDSGILGPEDVFRWVPEREGRYGYRDPVGGASKELIVIPPS